MGNQLAHITITTSETETVFLAYVIGPGDRSEMKWPNILEGFKESARVYLALIHMIRNWLNC